MQAKWNNAIIAESDATVVVEGNHYFPPESVNRDFLQASAHTSICHWKGTAHYYDIVVDGQTNPAAAWFYPAPKHAAEHLRDHIAFWKGVDVTR